MKSSYDVDAHLVTLSAQATLASRNKWGDKEDKYEQDPSKGSENVTVEPTNIYCYTFATPRTITSGVAKSRTLSVSAARGGAYQYDTPGQAYTNSTQGNVNSTASVYNGIHNYPFKYDYVTYKKGGTNHLIVPPFSVSLINIRSRQYYDFLSFRHHRCLKNYS